jgi:thiamine-phosphate pyrophosphorylase
MMPKTAAERGGLLRGLYAITPDMPDTVRLRRLVEAAIEGGARLVQYRAKALTGAERASQAGVILEACRTKGVPMIVNDDLDLAVAIGADGIHLGRDDPHPRMARERMPMAIIGVSCYDQPALAVRAALAGADYVGIGSVFPSRTKPSATRAGLDIIAEARAAGGIPVAAIGGIDLRNARHAVEAGADMIAVISALFDAPDVRAAATTLSQPFQDNSHNHVRTKPEAV